METKGKRKSRALAALLTLAMAFALLPVSAYAGEPVNIQDALTGVLDYLHNAEYAVFGGEWAALAINRGGRADAAWNNKYLEALETYIEEEAYSVDAASGKVTLDEGKTTENARVVLALTSMGIDASQFRGYDLVSQVSDKITAQSVNGAVYILLSLNSGDYSDRAFHDVCIDSLLENQEDDGGWGWGDGAGSEADLTAMALQALAPYEQKPGVASAVRAALAFLAEQQDPETGGFASWGSESAESAAQVIVALTALGNDTTPGLSLDKAVENLLSFRDGTTGGFISGWSGAVDSMSSEQAAYALVAYDRYVKGKNSLYDMSDASAGKKANLIIISAAALFAIAVLSAFLVFRIRRLR